MKNDKTVVERAAELLKNNPNLKYYEALKVARREKGAVDRGAISSLSNEADGKLSKEA